MPELLIELFSEEIPARMQARGAEDLKRLVVEALAALSPTDVRIFYGPRRIALAAEVAAGVAETRVSERGPRIAAPEAALAGFLRKHAATREDVRQDGDYWLLDRATAARPAAALIAGVLPGLLWRFPWPKSMRWGGTSAFTWVRPLRRILCLLDGAVVPFDLRDGDDDGHGLASSNLTEGHRFLAPGAFPVTDAVDWAEGLRQRFVLVDPGERRDLIAGGIATLADARGLAVVDDPGLLDEVAGLVEWPVSLLGRIDMAFMDLPLEVMQVSMSVNQRYFALRNTDGSAAPVFGFAANIDAVDEGETIIAGNERVLRARFSDARHFWDLDRRTPLESLVPKLEHVTFHAKLGSQGDRVRRIERLAGEIAPLVGADAQLARRAGYLSKADLVSGMVGEFPELQGTMGGYYARDDEGALIAGAIRDHYAPKGPGDAVPVAPVSIAVALADKLDQLAGFFAIGERPTGSGDPYALRRAALGILRIVRENQRHLHLGPLVSEAVRLSPALTENRGDFDVVRAVMLFLQDRLEVQLRSEGARVDVLRAVFDARMLPLNDQGDFLEMVDRADAVAALLSTPDGVNLLATYRRAAKFLRIEERRDERHTAAPDPNLYVVIEEGVLAATLNDAETVIIHDLDARDFAAAMAAMAALRAPLDAFFERVTVNDPEPDLRRNRLRLLARVRSTMDRVADFSKIEG